MSPTMNTSNSRDPMTRLSPIGPAGSIIVAPSRVTSWPTIGLYLQDFMLYPTAALIGSTDPVGLHGPNP
jgi:hypothetical protein